MEINNVNWTIALLIATFVLSGISSPLIVELIRANGGYFKYTMLIALPLCIGQSCAIFTNWKSLFVGVIRWRYIILISVLDSVSYAFNMHGFIYAGSVTYTIVHTSLTVYTAAFSVLFFEVEVNRIQSIGVITTVLGLIVAIINAERDGSEVLYGAILILIGTLIHSLTYIVSEYILVRVEDAISPELLCTISGLFPAVFYAIWQLLYTLPNYQVVVVDSIEAAHGSETVVIICYVLLAVAAFIHSTLFYYLIHKLGSPLTSSSKIIQSLIIFVSSHFAFCPTRKSQCLTTSKTISFALVLGGIVLYSFSHDHKSTRLHSNLLNDQTPPCRSEYSEIDKTDEL